MAAGARRGAPRIGRRRWGSSCAARPACPRVWRAKSAVRWLSRGDPRSPRVSPEGQISSSRPRPPSSSRTTRTASRRSSSVAATSSNSRSPGPGSSRTRTSSEPPHDRPTDQAVSSSTPYSSSFGSAPPSTARPSSTTAPSTHPPETEPLIAPSSATARCEPSGRGDEPQVRTTVASAKRLPEEAQSWRSGRRERIVGGGRCGWLPSGDVSARGRLKRVSARPARASAPQRRPPVSS